jgi:hypothetical protein
MGEIDEYGDSDCINTCQEFELQQEQLITTGANAGRVKVPQTKMCLSHTIHEDFQHDKHANSSESQRQ